VFLRAEWRSGVHVSAHERVKGNVNRFCALAGLLAVSACAADTQLSALLKAAEDRYNRTDTLQVLFREDYTRAGHAKRSENGLLDLRKPRQMRWEYASPKDKLAICDGKTFYTWYPDQNKVSQTPLQEDTLAPLAFLLGKLHFEKEFRNLQGRPEGNDTRVTAEPKTDNMPYSAVEFLMTSAGRIREVKVTRLDNSILQYTFDQEKMGVKLDDKLFHFQIPKGAEIVEPDK
jgi:chaperone LolA